jgi:exopolyphosphatase / guanosine-5'-triphosphate,3'-diphosphate pyrophosphatase
MRRACIDIGSNTTRLLVAECDGERLIEVHQERAFTHLRRGLHDDGAIGPEKLTELADVVSRQLRIARELGSREVHVVGTAAIRQARNRPEVCDAIRQNCAAELEVLSEDEEARFAFIGAARTLGRVPNGGLGVVDVGGGSSELVVGTPPDKISWSASFTLGSGLLADRTLHSDPPSAAEIDQARARVRETLNGIDVPHPAEAVAVGGSATSLHRLAGPLLDSAAFGRCLQLLCAERATEVARRFALDRERVRLLPAGLLILQAASELFGATLQIGRGGLREGILLEAARG